MSLDAFNDLVLLILALFLLDRSFDQGFINLLVAVLSSVEAVLVCELDLLLVWSDVVSCQAGITVR